MSYNDAVEFNILVGKTLKQIVNTGDDELIFVADNDESYKMYHSQDCCEHVYIEDICGDLNDLIGSPILNAEESTSEDFKEETGERPLWTFYRVSTAKGAVVIRWFGESDYYSVDVDFEELV